MPSTSAWRLRDTLTAAALFLATAAFTLWQNTRVAVLWDLSFLLDTSYRWGLGQLPYKDLPFPYAPLTFLLHTAIIKLFGRVYYPHILCAALEAGVATLLTWRILIHLLNQAEGANQSERTVIPAQPESPYLHVSGHTWPLAAILAAPLVVLGIYAIYPHPIYDSDCVLAVLLALYLLQRAESRSPNADSRLPRAAIYARNTLAGTACVLPLFIKQNIGLPFLLITLAVVAIIAITRRLHRQTTTPQLFLLAGALTTLAAALITLHLTVGLHNYLYWTVTFAAQRRLPGLAVILGIYNQPSLLWTLPAAVAAIILLHRHSTAKVPYKIAELKPDQKPGAPSIASSTAMGGILYRSIAILLLSAPFLWTILALTLTNDPSDRAGQLLSLWPHLLILSAALALYNLRPSNLHSNPTLTPFLPLILLATIHGAFLSQQLWGSTYAIWPLLTLLIAALLTQVPTIDRPMAAIIAATFIICGSLYAASQERLSYIHVDGPETHATLPQLHGLATPGPWIPDFEELIRFTDAEVPANDGILLIPGEVPFYFSTGRAPQFPILLFDPATDPYTPQQTLDQARAHNIRWLVVTRNLQLTGPPHPDLPEIIRTLQQDFTPYRTLTNYDIYRRN